MTLAIVGLLTALFFLSGCGVKGDPLPPESPAFIGKSRAESEDSFRRRGLQDPVQFPDYIRDKDDEEDERR